MDRRRLAKFLYALGVLLMPVSYSTKMLLGLPDVTWIDPTLVLAVPAFLLLGAPRRTPGSRALVLYAFASAAVGLLYMAPAYDRGHAALYVAFMEPVRLALNMLWFWVALRMFKIEHRFALRWLAIGLLVESAAALYLQLALFGLAPVGDTPALYLEIFKIRQAVWIGDLVLYRTAGTFVEGPPFGLYMFCCLLVFFLALSRKGATAGAGERRLWSVCCAVGFAGCIASLADQILLAIAAFGGAVYLARGGRRRRWESVVAGMLLVAILAYAGGMVAGKMNAASHEDVLGHSAGERMFHVRYALGLLAEHPAAVLTGIGPGRYGDYAVRTGIFPSSVSVQVVVAEWLVEMGLIGLLVITAWLRSIAHGARGAWGLAGPAAVAGLSVAVMFQANWKWEAWFVALAYLASAREPEAAATCMAADAPCLTAVG